MGTALGIGRYLEEIHRTMKSGKSAAIRESTKPTCIVNVMHPPLWLGEIVQRVNRVVGVLVIHSPGRTLHYFALVRHE
jgi:hypothetical protein